MEVGRSEYKKEGRGRELAQRTPGRIFRAADVQAATWPRSGTQTMLTKQHCRGHRLWV